MHPLLHEIDLRRAKRALSDRPVPPEMIGRVLQAATYAPSCFNNQPWRFLVLSDQECVERVHEALSDGNYWVKRAPVVVVVATRLDLDCRLDDQRDYALFCCGLAVENMLLQAFKEGLIAHPIAGFSPKAVKESFAIPEDFIVITLVAVGFPGEDSFLSQKHRQLEQSPRVRKSESEVICYNDWKL